MLINRTHYQILSTYQLLTQNSSQIFSKTIINQLETISIQSIKGKILKCQVKFQYIIQLILYLFDKLFTNHFLITGKKFQYLNSSKFLFDLNYQNQIKTYLNIIKRGFLKVLKQQRIQSESEEQKSLNILLENDFYTFSQIKDQNKFSNSQIVESSPQKKRNHQQIKKRQNLKEQADKNFKKSQQILDQSGGEVFDEIREEKSTFDQMQEIEGQESQIKFMKSKSKNTSFLKNSITVDTCSISDFAKNTNTNPKLNSQQDDETINVTSNLISDFQIKDIQKIYKQLTNQQQQQNNEQICNNFTNRCSIDSSNNINCFQDMILNVNGQIIYDQTELQNPSTIISINQGIYSEQSHKQLSRIEPFQQQVCLNQKNANLDLQKKQNMLDNLILKIKTHFQNQDSIQQSSCFSVDSIKKFKYYFPTFNYDIIFKQQEKYFCLRIKKSLTCKNNENQIKKH
ncbi:cyclic nucleotide-binding domain protein (macronuclear) [Tetrahymena thermophila SB210]|uniref:Cyclic nucleotide-binding domain protein n=1 Tax=Tetrahymena thermophila (strain SB210) TaxID=312017 RepID=W7XJQ5_TETTS|nr:cyclic nucleotide-binding domain protein [Tetrahymena thermophila SB210]EWS75806.1 cyclic nucleotide-binding domain protein [Tetrahymena thermophila SB210]|eukprot:XP_012651728.1 cyclic nucleotide-binding domain protein [Tetrahymena thermophila SB210]